MSNTRNVTKNTRFKIAVRALQSIFWIGILFCFLYTPYIADLVYVNKGITVLTWPEILDPQAIAEFEEATGITVNLSYLDSDEELYTKLTLTQGQGYDLVIATDYMIDLLNKAQVLQPIDKQKLLFWPSINTNLLGHYFDPNNTYSVPIVWGVYGLGIDRSYFADKELVPSWDLLFNKDKVQGTIGMTDKAREAILIADYYLSHKGRVASSFGDQLLQAGEQAGAHRVDAPQQFSPARIEEITKLLVDQKKWVQSYTDFRADYLLLSRCCPVVLVTSLEIWRTMRYAPEIDFKVPREGSFLMVDSFAMPTATRNQDAVYKFLNFVYQPRIMQHHTNRYGLFPVTTDVPMPDDVRGEHKELFFLTEELARKLHLFRSSLTDKQISDVWIKVKSY